MGILAGKESPGGTVWGGNTCQCAHTYLFLLSRWGGAGHGADGRGETWVTASTKPLSARVNTETFSNKAAFSLIPGVPPKEVRHGLWDEEAGWVTIALFLVSPKWVSKLKVFNENQSFRG